MDAERRSGSGKCTIYAFDWTRVPSLALLLVKSVSANDFRVEGTWGTSGNAVKTRVEHASTRRSAKRVPPSPRKTSVRSF